ncbi:MAG: Na+/H+ antiporter subunit D [Chloroflexi bacterium]|nr:Na+/H+ antiporter subunit D [Chloroflexota bacterium]
MNLLVVLPLLIPLSAAAVSVIAWPSPRLQRLLAVTGTVGLLAAGIGLLVSVQQNGIQAAQMGSWPAPFGITLVADLFSAIMVLITGLLGLVTVLYSLASVDARRESFGYYPLLLILLMGVCGIFLTGDIFNMYVWLEVTLISSFVLMALGGETPQLRGAIIYVVLNLIASVTMLTAVGILYGTTGALNMAHLSQLLNAAPQPGIVVTMGVLFMVAFSIKAAAFPLFFWLPESYHTPPPAVTAIFSALLTKAGIYALIRLFTLLFVQDTGFTHTIILVIAGFTMVTGVLGAVAQNQMRRLLSFHIISQIGYPLMGLGLFTPLGLAAAVFFIIHVILAKSSLFFVSGIVHKLRNTYDLKKLGGLYHAHPMVSLLFLFPALSLAGIPPFSGFFAKLALVRASVESSNYLILTVSLVVSILTLYSMTKIWAAAFWKNQDYPEVQRGAEAGRAGVRLHPLLVIPTGVIAALTVLLGLVAEPVMSLAFQAAEQLMNTSHYIDTVLGTP